MPFVNMVTVSLRSQASLSQTKDSSILPMVPVTYNYEGKDYTVYKVPTDTGVQEWALVKPTRTTSQFIDPKNPDAGIIDVGRQLAHCWTRFRNLIRCGATIKKPGT